MKLKRGPFWAVILIVWTLEVLIYLGTYQERKGIPGYAIALMLVLLGVYLVAIMLRLKDAGQSMGLVLVCFIVPVAMFIFGAMRSAEDECNDDINVERHYLNDEKKNINY